MDAATKGHAHIFISYSHKDKLHFERLRTHLEPYRRAGFDVWDDTRIRVGQLWREEIKRALAVAKVAILLVSADFLASPFISENELPPLLAAANQDGTVILTVVIGACNFSETPLARFQAFNSLSNPLNDMKPPKRDKIWMSVAKAAADALAGPLYSEQIQNAEVKAASERVSGNDTVLGFELDTLIALQQTLKNAPKNTRFPYFALPLGPLWATSDDNLHKAVEIRRRVLRTIMMEADKELAADDKSSDRYYGYLRIIGYLRSMFDSEQWLRFENMHDTFEVIAEITPEMFPLLGSIPDTEVECYEQEQIAVAHFRYDLSKMGVRYVSPFSSGKQNLYGE